MHLRGPAPKGRYALFTSSCLCSSSNLSGQNFMGSFQYLGECWRAQMLTRNWVPLGKRCPSTSASTLQSLLVRAVAGWRRSVSLMTASRYFISCTLAWEGSSPWRTSSNSWSSFSSTSRAFDTSYTAQVIVPAVVPSPARRKRNALWTMCFSGSGLPSSSLASISSCSRSSRRRLSSLRRCSTTARAVSEINLAPLMSPRIAGIGSRSA
mmetsp:Transcript_17627/g.68434  ORF Transcript_17627/g.68434 Transcript_17627/m.68434 type:complete len:209 (-) Transcript_17627:374-1000(-)